MRRSEVEEALLARASYSFGETIEKFLETILKNIDGEDYKWIVEKAAQHNMSVEKFVMTTVGLRIMKEFNKYMEAKWNG